MLTFLMKDLLLFWRDRKEVIIVILLPLVLVVVLSVAMSGLFDGNLNENYELSLGVVNEDNQEEAITDFEALVNQSQQIPEELKQELLLHVQAAPPVELLTDFLTSPDVESWITIQTMSRSEAEQSVDNGELNAMLVIPENYSAKLLTNIYLDQGDKPSLLFVAKETAVEVDMLHDVIQGFLDQMNLQYALSTSGGDIENTHVELPEGGTENIEDDQSATFTMNQYFAFSMGTLFVLFMTSTVASRTGIEKREHTFNRIALTNTPALHFLFGKTVATFILSWLQIMFVFIGSHLILGVFEDRSFTFWIGLIFMASMYSLAIAGVSSILTSISLRLKNPDAVDGIFMIIIMLFGIIGGSFVPIYILPNWLQQIGEWTPNGLTLATLIEWFQFEDVSMLLIPMIVLLVITFITIILSIFLYPKRGEFS
ncbi:ABC transporter permease [Pseudogracilibacillus auburnensis]|uniref:ABC transporter permease n=1 Tax=Pseudogracilibacillus auburnensis TaxID=1494959 RepID=UPI001A96D34E|nr:ABC transporter permease [Pseudogracilibacillus auburnensis]MBO1001637.1 ABC transporter permease [Pseudogracilibacillus auburnensis]